MTARRLIVMRHCKSSWSTGLDDHARPLNGRGRADAPRVGARLHELGWTPDLCLSSDSMRTRETWDGMSAAFDGPVPVQFTRALYHAGVGQLQPLLAEIRDDVRTLLVLGHNPGWEDVVGWFCGTPCHMTTGNAALLHSERASWADAVQGRWSLADFIRPREL